MIRDTVDAFKKRMHSLNLAYLRTFDVKSVDANIVLKDLAKFCRAHDSTFNPDPRIHAVLEGRREVWLRIQEQLNLNLEEIYQLHRVREYNTKGEHGGREA